jgi:hypothetical protein
MLSFSKGEMVLDLFVFFVFVFVCDFHLTCFSFFFFFCSCWLPTGGTGKCPGGLNAFNFLCVCTWMRVHNAKESQGMVQGHVVMAQAQCCHGTKVWKGVHVRPRHGELLLPMVDAPARNNVPSNMGLFFWICSSQSRIDTFFVSKT